MRLKMEEKNNIEIENKKANEKQKTVEKGESFGKVMEGYFEPSEADPETHEEELKRVLSEYPETVVSNKEKEELKRTAKRVDDFMKRLDVTRGPVIKSARINKKGRMKEELQTTINVDKENSIRENSSNNRENVEGEMQEIE